MATFDKTTIANQTGWQNGVTVKSWTLDFDEMTTKEGLASTDDIRLIAIPTGTAMIFFASTTEVNRILAGTSGTIDIGIDGGVEIDGAVDIKVTAGTITLNDTNAAPVLYTNTSGATTYVTVEPTSHADVTDHGKVTVTLVYAKVSN